MVLIWMIRASVAKEERGWEGDGTPIEMQAKARESKVGRCKAGTGKKGKRKKTKKRGIRRPSCFET